MNAAAQTAGVGVARIERSHVELTGDDRASFLHNLSTNNIRALQPGDGCEAFLCDAKGHVLDYVYVFCAPHSLLIDAGGGHGERLLKHLDRYLIREKVELVDRSAEWAELIVTGPQSHAQLEQQLGAAPPTIRLQHAEAAWRGHPVWVRAVDYCGLATHFVVGPSAVIDSLLAGLIEAGAAALSDAAVDAARIDAGTPLYGRDISETNLPQEVARDAQAISFTKGCYLGQETVARIDALGHVNKTLVQVRWEGVEVPQPGAILRADGKEVGTVTSAALSPATHCAVALAYVRRGHNTPGTQLESDAGPCLLPHIQAN